MTIEVFFGTNRTVRRRNKDQQPVDFGTKINTSKPLLHFGKAKLSGKGKRIKKLTTSKNTSPEELCCSQEIFNEICDRMHRGIDTILFFHGFNTNFRNSLIEAARLKYLYEKESGCEYTMIVISWPSSKGLPLFTYKNDKSKANGMKELLASTIYELNKFFMELCWIKFDQKAVSDTGENKDPKKKCKKPSYGRLHVMAHSMGIYVLRHILQGLYKLIGNKIPQLFDEVLLIAADEDGDAFEYESKLKFLPQLAKRVSIYFNREDFLLRLSDWLMRNKPRLGSEGPFQPKGIPANVFLIDCEDVVDDDGLFEHTYHKTESVVRRDIAHVLAGGEPEVPWRVYMPETNSYRLIDTEKDPHLEPPIVLY